MSILDSADITTYAPSFLDEIGTPELEGKQDFVQAIIESPKGCNRPIEVTEFTEILDNYQLSAVYPKYNLAYTPVYISEGYTPRVEVKRGAKERDVPFIAIAHPNNVTYADGYARTDRYYLRDLQYIELPPEEFEISAQGELTILNQLLIQDFKVTYQAGFDFTQNTPEIKKIKAAFANVLNFIYKSNAYEGISSVQVPFDEYTIKYNTRSVSPYEIPEHLLYFFWQYRPRDRVI